MPPSHAAVDQLVRAYLAAFPDEAAGMLALQSQVDAGDDLFSRSNMRGHITASSLVYDEGEDKILTIYHNLLQRVLQPGGHVEGELSLPEDAKRETTEETAAESALHPYHGWVGVPFDIDTHEIPAQPAKNEGVHLHHDFIYLFTGNSRLTLTPQIAEVKRAEWIPREAFRALPGHRFGRLVHKLDIVYGRAARSG